MIVWKNCKFGRINFGNGKMHGWVCRDREGNVRASISEGSHQDMADFKILRSAVAAGNVDFEEILPKGWTSYPDLRSASAT